MRRIYGWVLRNQCLKLEKGPKYLLEEMRDGEGVRICRYVQPLWLPFVTRIDTMWMCPPGSWMLGITAIHLMANDLF